MPKKIIISFDGTWNTPDTRSEIKGSKSTNVWKLHASILPADNNGVLQDSWYDKGVGTAWYDRLAGGAFGVGLSEKILDGYRQLVRTYGFSRGAYTARSLVGLIRNAGLLKPEHLDLTNEAYSLYRTRDEGADSERARLFRDSFFPGDFHSHARHLGYRGGPGRAAGILRLVQQVLLRIPRH
jgi:uncharacterized protein (DUF2235 family)